MPGVEYTDPATFGVLLDPGQSFTCRYDAPRLTGEPVVFRAQVFEWAVDGFSFLRELDGAPTLVSLPGAIPAGIPTVSGTVKVDRPLTATTGVWGPQPIRTLVLPPSLVGKSITVTVIGSRDGYADARSVSAPVGPVKEGAFSAAPVPVITGTATVGGTLVTDVGVWVRHQRR